MFNVELVFVHLLFENFGSVENLFQKFEAPLAPSLPPLGGGDTYDSSVLPRNTDLGNTALSRLGRHSGGAKPLERRQDGGFLQSQNFYITHPSTSV